MTTSNLTRCGIFTALLAVSSQIATPIPFTTIPLSLASLMVLLSGCLLGAVWGSLSVCMYLTLGALGLPVFSNFGGGISYLLGPTGGFLLGYIPASFVAGTATTLTYRFCMQNKIRTVLLLSLGLVLAQLVLYISGTLFFANYTDNKVQDSLILTVVPFVLGDTVKILICLVLTLRLKNRLYQF